MDKVKRVRSANFSRHESDILISLVKRNRGVLESKQSDASTWRNKEATWERIKNEFNARSEGVYRSTKTLKVKYEGMKRTVRKKSAVIRSELYRTGGGRNTAPPLDDMEEEIKAIITVNTDGLKRDYDSDTEPHSKESQDEVLQTPTNSSSNMWDVTSRRNLKSRKHPALNVNLQHKRSHCDELTQSQLELVKLQKEFLEAEMIEKTKEWEFNEKERQWKEEEYMLRLEKLRKELNE